MSNQGKAHTTPRLDAYNKYLNQINKWYLEDKNMTVIEDLLEQIHLDKNITVANYMKLYNIIDHYISIIRITTT